jgi:hypothetical protein
MNSLQTAQKVRKTKDEKNRKAKKRPPSVHEGGRFCGTGNVVPDAGGMQSGY